MQSIDDGDLFSLLICCICAKDSSAVHGNNLAMSRESVDKALVLQFVKFVQFVDKSLLLTLVSLKLLIYLDIIRVLIIRTRTDFKNIP